MFYCGIDVAKRKHAVVVLDDRGRVKRKVFEINNTQDGLNRLVDELEPFGDGLQGVWKPLATTGWRSTIA